MGKTDLEQDCCEHAQVRRPIGDPASPLNLRCLADRDTRELRFDIDLASETGW
jgi:hypothetical protein